MSDAPPKPPTESRNLLPVLLIGGFVLFCCIGVPVVSGLGAAFFLQMHAVDAVEEAASGPMDAMAQPEMPVMPAMPAMPGMPSLPTFPGDAGPVANKLVLEQQMQIAEQVYRSAQAQYDAAQAVYEQQRNFALQQGGRLGAQGIQVPQPQPPDPSLVQQVEAARIQYENAKAAYEAVK